MTKYIPKLPPEYRTLEECFDRFDLYLAGEDNIATPSRAAHPLEAILDRLDKEFFGEIDRAEIDALFAPAISEPREQRKPRIPRKAGRRLPKTADTLPKEPGYVYLIAFEGLYKIGMTINIRQRMRALERKWSMQIGTYTIVHVIHASDMIYLESLLHRHFAPKNVHCEWFDLAPDDVAWIMGLGSELDDMQILLVAAQRNI